MSGFFAVLNTDGRPVDRALLEKQTASLITRGPDMHTVWADGAVGMAHALFRTTHEAQYENQPATLDGNTWICGCIRIDARDELLGKLGLRSSIRLTETPDSQLVLHAYKAWGEQCLEHLLGDFAFALWDGANNKLFCARDRFGLRQLCYAQQRNTFVVGNSIDCLRQYPGVSDELCDAAIGDFLLFGDHRWGDRSVTAFADIRTIEPGHYLVLSNGKPRTQRYWSIDSRVPLLRYRRETEYLDHFGDTFNAAVSDRLRTDKVIISLSGGMDSTSIAALIVDSQRRKKSSTELNAISVLHDSLHPSDERFYIEEVSRFLGISPRYIDGGAYGLLTPYVQTSCPLELYQPQLSLEVDTYNPAAGRVLLTGDGGDELFAFSSVKSSLEDISPLEALAMTCRLRRRYGITPTLGTGLMALKGRLGRRTPDAHLPYAYPDWINPDFEQQLGLKQRWATYWSDWQSYTRANRSRHPHIARSLLMPDWNTDDFYMNSGCTLMEQRCPFLDPRLVGLIMALPALPWLFRKHLLRRRMENKLPATVLSRPKTLLGLLHESLLKDHLLEKFTPAENTARFIDPNWMRNLPTAAGTGSRPYINLRPQLLNRWFEALEV
jgi:asparagine synthase (glutamine-hydrolysing)